MIYMRGAEAGLRRLAPARPQWLGWDDVKPLFMRQQDHFGGLSEHHGAGGGWRVEEPRMRWEILDAFIEAAKARGIRETKDFNTGSNEGVGYFQVNQRNGLRWSAAKGFLKPALNRPNLRLIKQAEVSRLLFEARAWSASNMSAPRARRRSRRRPRSSSPPARSARRSCCSSPASARARRCAIGIPVVADLPGVGANLQDHLQLRPVFKVHGVTHAQSRQYSRS